MAKTVKNGSGNRLAKFFRRIFFTVLHFVYSDTITKTGLRVIKICKIPVITISRTYDL